MAGTINLNIAGIEFRLNGITDEARQVIEKRYGEFIGGNGSSGEWNLNWDIDINEEGPWEPDFIDADRKWKFSRGDLEAVWDREKNYGTAALDLSEFTIDTMLRIWISTLLLSTDGGLFHSAGIIRDGRGLLFIGKSGAGKSTIAGMSDTESLLSDELVAVRRKGAGFEIFGTPFMGELNIGGKNKSAGIDSFYVLNNCGAEFNRELKEVDAVGELWGSLMCFSKGFGTIGKALKLCENMASDLNCREFSYDINEGPWRLIDG